MQRPWGTSVPAGWRNSKRPVCLGEVRRESLWEMQAESRASLLQTSHSRASAPELPHRLLTLIIQENRSSKQCTRGLEGIPVTISLIRDSQALK